MIIEFPLPWCLWSWLTQRAEGITSLLRALCCQIMMHTSVWTVRGPIWKKTSTLPIMLRQTDRERELCFYSHSPPSNDHLIRCDYILDYAHLDENGDEYHHSLLSPHHFIECLFRLTAGPKASSFLSVQEMLSEVTDFHISKLSGYIVQHQHRSVSHPSHVWENHECVKNDSNSRKAG